MGRPILGFGAARPGLYVQKCIVGVHLAGKHALEFELLHLAGEPIDVGLDFPGCPRIGLRGRQIEQLPRVAQGLPEPIQATDHLLELGTFPAQFLRAFGVAPDAGLFELALYFLKTLVLVVVIKIPPQRVGALLEIFDESFDLVQFHVRILAQRPGARRTGGYRKSHDPARVTGYTTLKCWQFNCTLSLPRYSLTSRR